MCFGDASTVTASVVEYEGRGISASPSIGRKNSARVDPHRRYQSLIQSAMSTKKKTASGNQLTTRTEILHRFLRASAMPREPALLHELRDELDAWMGNSPRRCGNVRGCYCPSAFNWLGTRSAS